MGLSPSCQPGVPATRYLAQALRFGSCFTETLALSQRNLRYFKRVLERHTMMEPSVMSWPTLCNVVVFKSREVRMYVQQHLLDNSVATTLHRYAPLFAAHSVYNIFASCLVRTQAALFLEDATYM